MRTTCPSCGSDRTYYNEKYKTWKCLKCEKSFVVEDLRPTKDGIRTRKVSKPKDEFVEHWERQGKPPRAYKPSKAMSRLSWVIIAFLIVIGVFFMILVFILWT